MFKISKVKGGRIGLINNLNKKLKGRGTPAVKKINVEELEQIDEEYNKNLKGEGVRKIKKSIKPLQFRN